jgi:hypothetical protein
VTQNADTGIRVDESRPYETRPRRNLEEISTSEAHTRTRFKLAQLTSLRLKERTLKMGRKIEWHFANHFGEFSPIKARKYIHKSRHRGVINLHMLKPNCCTYRSEKRN